MIIALHNKAMEFQRRSLLWLPLWQDARFHTANTEAYQWTWCSASCIRPHLLLDLPSGCFPRVSPQKFCKHLSPPPELHTWCIVISNISLSHKSWCSLSCPRTETRDKIMLCSVDAPHFYISGCRNTYELLGVKREARCMQNSKKLKSSSSKQLTLQMKQKPHL